MRLALGGALTLAMAGAATADPTPFDGHYRQNVADLCVVQDDTSTIQIEDHEFWAGGNSCKMSNPVNVLDMNAMLYDMSCTSDDDTWLARAFFSRAADGGLIIVWDGYAFRYDACAPDGAVGAIKSVQDVGVQPTLASE